MSSHNAVLYYWQRKDSACNGNIYVLFYSLILKYEVSTKVS